MEKVYLFFYNLYQHSIKDDIVNIANGLTYKLLLAVFPFIIFAMSLIGFFSLDGDYFLMQISGSLPDEVFNMIRVFVEEVVNIKSPGILSFSLLVSIYSASSGFNAIMTGINKAHGCTETRSFILRRILSVFLTIAFAVSLFFSIAMFIFENAIKNLLHDFNAFYPFFQYLFSLTGYLAAVFILLGFVMLVNKFAVCEKVKMRNMLPGSAATVFIWVLASEMLNVYINNFSKYSKVYGSIGSIFILVLWLNFISYALLIGGEINASLFNE